MSRYWTSLALLLLAVAVSAADEPKAQPLTRQEFNDGWLQLFDGESLFGWAASGDGQWGVTAGVLAPVGQNPATLVTTSEFADFELKVEYQARKGTFGEVRIGTNSKGESGRSGELAFLGDGWCEYSLTVTGSEIKEEVRTLGGNAGVGRGGAGPRGLKSARGHIAVTGNGIVVRSVKVRPLNAKPLFNGKDLTGWKVFPGDKYKSVFAVEDGVINVKNGPGDLQSEGQWADFILQLECVSNGKFLNSGVFFRALPDQYQQGYEAQIRNEFKDEPSQEYTLDVYDPKTNELKEKVKKKFTAVDFGTGAIYRRQPARKAVAKDGEWFTMTVLANGRHLATWVDGVQVADWTDHRPHNANGRNGCRLEKGCISFQGHDPTTDLSFRNIRIAELLLK